MKYEEFRKKVDKHVRRHAGLGLDDLADFDLYPYLDLIGEETSAKEIAEIAEEAAIDLLHSEGFPADLLDG